MAVKNLTRHKYGRWTVLAFAGFNKHGGSLWQCKCSCGTIQNVRSNALRTGHSQSCGCLHRQRASENLKRVGKGPSHPNWRGGIGIRQGYITVRDRQSKEVLMHKLIAKHALGRELQTDEVVHHINGNKLDNRNCNLLICDRQYHTWLHQRMSQKYMERHLS